MGVTPFELWEHARSLPAKTQAEIRTKVSRAYYALYSHACVFNDGLPATGNLYKKEAGSHSQLTQKLTNPNLKNYPSLEAKSRNLGTKQKLAHEIRVKADYDLADPITQIELAKCLRYVEAGLQIKVEDDSDAPKVA